MRATQRPAPQGWPRGDGDGPPADGRAPVECRAHRAPPERRQRHAARVEPVGRGGTNGGGVALRPGWRISTPLEEMFYGSKCTPRSLNSNGQVARADLRF